MHCLTVAAFSPPPVATYRDGDRLMLKAMRFWVIFARSGRSPRTCLAGLLGIALAARFSLLMESVTVAWPEPFTTFPPCACQSSPDEATLMTLFGFATADRVNEVGNLLGDMLPESDRLRIWSAAVRCASEWPEAL